MKKNDYFHLHSINDELNIKSKTKIETRLKPIWFGPPKIPNNQRNFNKIERKFNTDYKIMTSPYTAPSGTQKFGNIEYEWLPLLKTPCLGFSGPFACYSTSCNHNPKLGYQPLPHQQNYIRKYPIAKKPAYFALFQTNDTNCAPKLSTIDHPIDDKCDSVCSQYSCSASLSPTSSGLSNYTYDSHEHYMQIKWVNALFLSFLHDFLWTERNFWFFSNFFMAFHFLKTLFKKIMIFFL